MTSRAKLIERVKRCPTDLRFSEVQRLMDICGASLARVKGSHHIYRLEGRTLSVVAHDERVAVTYVRKIIEFLGLREEGDEE
jgi:predicted RNA binding protein YcfA (HicA-like mRNA interferase family)